MNTTDYFSSHPEFGALKNLTPLVMPEAVAAVKDVVPEMSELLSGATKPSAQRYSTWLDRQYDYVLTNGSFTEHPSRLLAERGFRLPTQEEIELSPFQTINSWAISLWPVTNHPSSLFDNPWAFNGLVYSKSLPPTVFVTPQDGHAQSTLGGAYLNTTTWEPQSVPDESTDVMVKWVVKQNASADHHTKSTVLERIQTLSDLGRVVMDNREHIQGGVNREDLVNMFQSSWSELRYVPDEVEHDPSKENAEAYVSRVFSDPQIGGNNRVCWPTFKNSQGVLLGLPELQLMCGWASMA